MHGDAGEEHGRVWFGALGWSGNWRITVEQTPYRQVRVTGGFNNFDFAYPLKPGETPRHAAFLRRLHRRRLRRRLAHCCIASSASRSCPAAPRRACARCSTTPGKPPRSTSTKPGQKALADKAAKLGVELFVMDDGWFGKRNNDHAGLGDWYVNPQKFPQGLKPLIDHVNGLGMDFGLWVEPEMVNADSDLYRAHPDWVINFPGPPAQRAAQPDDPQHGARPT